MKNNNREIIAILRGIRKSDVVNVVNIITKMEFQK